MKVFYKNSVFARIKDKIIDAETRNVKIDYIELSSKERDELLDELDPFRLQESFSKKPRHEITCGSVLGITFRVVDEPVDGKPKEKV